MMRNPFINYSSSIEIQIKQFELDYPMGSYIPYWKLFRAYSKENELIANVIKSTDTWKSNENKSIVDIGTGDGLVLKLLCKSNMNSVVMVEPNDELLSEAKKNLFHINPITPINKDLFSLNFKKYFTGHETILIIHVLYLLEKESLSRFLEKVPKGSNLIIVTDDTNSLFVDCWQITAQKYANRSKNIHNEINILESMGKISYKKSEFRTLLKNPFYLERKDLQNALLSMITYSEFELLSTNNKIDVKEVFNRYSDQEIVYCDSVCYELIKI